MIRQLGVWLLMAVSSKRLQRELERFAPENGIDISVDDYEQAVFNVNMKVRLSMEHNPLPQKCYASSPYLILMASKGHQCFCCSRWWITNAVCASMKSVMMLA